ncbi:MAG: SDR family NAD(P)-dependent oxidoreductase, partial [Bacteroidota bacterium]
MNYFYITGDSRGIGRAVASELLKDKRNIVYGISRNSTIQDRNYTHIYLDLNDLESVKTFPFNNVNDAEKVVLLNNAGILGHVTQVGNIDNDSIIQAQNVNLTSAMILTNKFISAYQNSDAKKIIINTSSGAARHSNPSWGTYCSTKAGLEMFARVIHDEQKDNSANPIRIFSIAPGIVDTDMQERLRSVDPKDFKGRERFIKLKERGKLVSPESIALQYID